MFAMGSKLTFKAGITTSKMVNEWAKMYGSGR